jgi:hypothetical protein
MGVLSALKTTGLFPSCSAALIPRGAPEQAPRPENHAYSNRGSGNINSAINQGSMAAGYVPLMELVSKGIEANNGDAPYRLTQPPPKRLLLRETTIDEKGQDSILRHVGCLPQESVQNMERSG